MPDPTPRGGVHSLREASTLLLYHVVLDRNKYPDRPKLVIKSLERGPVGGGPPNTAGSFCTSPLANLVQQPNALPPNLEVTAFFGAERIAFKVGNNHRDKGNDAGDTVCGLGPKWRSKAAEQLLPHGVSAALTDVAPLRKKKTTAPELPRVRPVALEVVEATLPLLPPIPADMVRFQLYTGCRPGEACALRPCDLDRAWKVIDGVGLWLYRLDEHKTDWKGIWRWIPVEPRAQAVLLPYLDRPAESYCFSPSHSLSAAPLHPRSSRVRSSLSLTASRT